MLKPTPPTEHYSAEFLEAALMRFPEQALWLLLSIDHYGWRAHADLIHILLLEVPAAEGDLGHHLLEHRYMAGLEELYLALDQLWRLVDGVQAHRKGEDFLEAYCVKDRNMEAHFHELKQLDEAGWRDFLRVPEDTSIRAALEAEGGDEKDVQMALAKARDVARLGPINAQEFVELFLQPGSSIPGREGHSARTLNNQYRHGTRVLYEDCSPTRAGWTVANPERAFGPTSALGDIDDLARDEVVNILLGLPDVNDEATFGSIAFGRPYRKALVDSTAAVAVLVKRIVASFLASEVQGGAPTLASIADYEWSPPTFAAGHAEES